MEHLHRCACNPRDQRDLRMWKCRRKWSIRRAWIETPNAQPRWDRAYQYLLRWSLSSPLGTNESMPRSIPQSIMEVEDNHDRTD